MELRHLRHFVAVAEELHFGRAALRLGMAQPPLSQSLMRLEANLGVTLLDRKHHHVTLTPAGQALLKESRPLLAQAALAEMAVQRAAAGVLPHLRISFVPMSLMRILPLAIRQFRHAWPGVQVQLAERSSRHTVDNLRNGSIDLGVVVRSLVDADGLELRTIERTRIVAAIPAQWPLGQRTSVRLAELASASFVLFPQQMINNFYTAFEATCRNAGFTPDISQQVNQAYTMFNLVANGLGIGLVQASARGMRVEGVALVDIEDLPDSFITEVAIAWMPNTVSPPLHSMIATLEEMSARDNATNPGRVLSAN
ncbi:MAG: LysR family transcriptional regulator [Pseudomonadota bacterium]